MRIRAPFAGTFVLLLLAAAYLGLSTIQINVINDKVLHFFTFFLLTLCFYWVVEASRRRALNFTLVVCTVVLGVGSEVVQGFVPNDRSFDFYDILANIVGSLAALGICSWYHKGMLERKRRAKQYHILTGDEEGGDVELGGIEPQESGVTDATPGPTIEEEVDNWDENAEDAWDDEDITAGGEAAKTPSGGIANDEVAEGKKRDD